MKFTEVIVIRMENSTTREELEKIYQEGCNKCACSGIHQRCDRCPVEPTYERMINVVNLMEAIRKVDK